MNTLTYYFELANEDLIDLTVSFKVEDNGWGEGFSGTHGKEVDLSYEIHEIESEDDTFSMLLHNPEFYNQVRTKIENDDNFLEQADAITAGNDYEEY